MITNYLMEFGYSKETAQAVEDNLDRITPNHSYDDFINYMAYGVLTINDARNGREVMWYNDGITEEAIYLDDGSRLSEEEIEEELV